MQHGRKGRQLGRTAAPRKAMMRNLATSLVLYERIKTTKAKAKSLRGFIEPIITGSKKNTLLTRRMLLSTLMHKNAVKKALEVLGPRYEKRPGGYTRIIPLKRRVGDAAETVYIELV